MKQTYHIASCSMGKDSLAMLLLLLSTPRRFLPLDYVVFYNTGMEFECIYEIRDRVKVLCEDQGIQFVELHPEVPFLYSMLEREIRYRDGSGVHYGYSWCGGRCRWATRHKLDAITKFKNSLDGECIDYVGIAADEQNRIPSPRPSDKRYPLADLWNMTEADCLEYCHSQGWAWKEFCPVTRSGYIDLYDILNRVSCWCCSNKNQKELYNIYIYLPQYWEQLKRLQRRTDRPMKGYYKGKPKGIFELEEIFRQKSNKESMNNIEELHK